MNTPTPAQTGTLTATRISDAQRIHFWPKHFGKVPKWALIEPRIFRWLDRLCADYQGDFWDFYTLPNGGAFMVPGTEQDYVLFNALNGNGATVSRDAAGVVACLMTYSHHACRTECDAMTEHYYLLRDYALRHPECSAIMHIID
ncbi:TPA: antirestriction protein [Yersinia enterocolitica]